MLLHIYQITRRHGPTNRNITPCTLPTPHQNSSFIDVERQTFAGSYNTDITSA